MPRVRFDDSPSSDGNELIPPNKYLCTITQIDRTQTRKGDEMWKLRLEVEEGPHANRCVFDNLVFSEAALPRLKLFCAALGLPTTGDLDLQPDQVQGKSCMVSIRTEDYQDNEGLTRTSNKVAYEGYFPVPKPSEEAGDDDDLPF